MVLPDFIISDIPDEILTGGISELRSVSGGSINQAAILTNKSGSSFFIKWNVNGPEGMFKAEVAGLQQLAAPAVIKVPEVIYCGGERAQYLVLEHLQRGSCDRHSQRLLGERLAMLHRETHPQFGFHQDNFIGFSPQRNSFQESWGEFFIECRLSPQLSLARTNGVLSHKSDELFLRTFPAIQTALNESDEPPALLHGDLWSGNVYWSNMGPALIDPAVYYGSREADIAFTELFGRFDREFYDAYQAHFALLPGYEIRREILNLYHLLNHANMFGGSYIRTVHQSLEEISSELSSC